ncbi:alpha-L-fucosidase [Cohnella silvisoli]|uniref:alpha-L-fucosidase n=1 Tax=Cohnella silvisoli TaxID=2873699 RepID=A0ABV1KXP8_9BACL|nr:alpha-L-fucosidase [Cohnella silvisoli]MCD9023765.1 alpha-L-fucosidase [Cohnella silvisoli]
MGEKNSNERQWSDIDARPIPAWFNDYKLGIFIHWGLYSVPAWAPKRSSVNTPGEAYAEWYGSAVRQQNGQYRTFHQKIYGESFKYEDFAAQFKAELFDPHQWAQLFQRSGARYVVLTAKHHDAFCLWPSQHSWNWNSVDIGPHRDLYGELSSAVVGKGLKMGAYYSLLEWFNPLYVKDPEAYALKHMIPQMKQLVEAYRPSVLFTDGEWEHASGVWHSREFLEWLFTESSVRDEIVVNDRWGKDTRGKHGGYFTTEYGEVGYGPEGQLLEMSREWKWEECRGIGTSFGYNRNETLNDYMTEEEVIHLLVDTVSRGGNLLLNVGPTADGLIPVIMEERLTQLGVWLEVNGEAVFGTHKWRDNQDSEFVRYTYREGTLYAIALRWPGKQLVLQNLRLSGDARISMLGWNESLSYEETTQELLIRMPAIAIDSVPCRHAYVFKIEGVR